jgi:hypothetical protein
MPVAMGSHNGTCGGPNRCAASASDRTADDRATDRTSSCGALRHDIRNGHGKSHYQQN